MESNLNYVYTVLVPWCLCTVWIVIRARRFATIAKHIYTSTSLAIAFFTSPKYSQKQRITQISFVIANIQNISKSGNIHSINYNIW